MTTESAKHASNDRIDSGAATLWASALVILALVILQAGRLGAGSQARAEVTEIGDTVLLTAYVEANEQVLLVMDSRTDTMLVYGVVNRNTLELRETKNVAEMFNEIRGNAMPGGRPRR